MRARVEKRGGLIVRVVDDSVHACLCAWVRGRACYEYT